MTTIWLVKYLFHGEYGMEYRHIAFENQRAALTYIAMTDPHAELREIQLVKR